MFSVLDQQAFEEVYTSMARALRATADTQIANFKADILTLMSQQNELAAAATSPLAMRLMSQLEVLH